MFLRWLFPFAFLFSPLAQAFVPPTYYMAEKVAKHRSSLETAIVQIQLQRPILGAEKGQANVVWQGNLFYNSARTIVAKDSKRWPLLQLLLEPDARKVLASWRAFGLPVNREEDLVVRRSKQELKASPEAEPPFYRREEGLSLRRFGSRLVYQITNTNSSNKLMLEKESFDPLSMVAQCPDGTISAMLDGGKGSCSVEFHYETNSSMNIPSSAVLKVGDQDVLVMKISRVIVNPSEKLIRDLVKPIQQETLEQTDELAAAFYTHFLR